MLSVVVATERPELEESFSRVTQAAHEQVAAYKEIEEKLLRILRKSVENILEDEEMLLVIEESKQKAEEVALKMTRVKNMQTRVLRARGSYLPISYRAAVLYFVVSDLYRVNNMYQFSMNWYIDLYRTSLRKAL